MGDAFSEKKRKRLEELNIEKNGLNCFANIYDGCEKNLFRVYWNVYEAYKKLKKEKEGIENFFITEEKKKKEILNNIIECIKCFIEQGKISGEKDKSIKQSVDILLFPCFYEINKNECYYTTSSCSGRIVILGEFDNNGYNNNKQNRKTDILETKEKKKEQQENTKIEQAFLDHFKNTSLRKNTKRDNENEDDNLCFSDNTYDISQWKVKNENENQSNVPTKKPYKRNIHMYYVCHTHQNLEKEAYIAIIQKIKKSFFNLNSTFLNNNASHYIEEGLKLHKSSTHFSDDEVKKLHKQEIKRVSNVLIKFEPFIIHTMCANLFSAFKLLKIVQYAGLKNSGILNDGEFVTVSIRGSTRLEHSLGNNINVNEDLLLSILELCNKKMSLNFQQILCFYKCYKNFINSENSFCNIKAFHKIYDTNKKSTQKVELKEVCADNVNTSKLREFLKRNKRKSKKDEQKLIKNTKINENNTSDTRKLCRNENINVNNLNGIEKMCLLKWEIILDIFENYNFYVRGHDMFINERKIYLYGGNSKNGRSNKLYIYDMQKRKLFISDTKLMPLLYHTFCKFDNKYAIIFGGRQSPVICYNNLWVYNIKKDTWIMALNRTYSYRKMNKENFIKSNDINEYSIWKYGSEIKEKAQDREDKEMLKLKNGGLFASDNYKEKICKKPCGRYRHACVFIKMFLKKKRRIYIFYVYGGIDKNRNVLNDLWKGKLCITENDEAYIYWKRENMKQNSVALYNHTMIFNKKRNHIFFIGGFNTTFQETIKRKEFSNGMSNSVSNRHSRNGNIVRITDSNNGESDEKNMSNCGSFVNMKNDLKEIVEHKMKLSKANQQHKMKLIEEMEANNEKLKKEHINMDNGEMRYIYAYDMGKKLFYYVEFKSDRTNNLFPLNRFSHCGCMLNENYYIVLGGLNKHESLDDIWIMNVKKLEWIHIGKFIYNSIYIHSKCAVEKNTLFIVGGGCNILNFKSYYNAPRFANYTQLLNYLKYRNTVVKKDKIETEQKISDSKIEEMKCVYHSEKNEKFSKDSNAYAFGDYKSLSYESGYPSTTVDSLNVCHNNVAENIIDPKEKKQQPQEVLINDQNENNTDKSNEYIYNDNEELYIIVKNKIFVKKVKMLLERMQNYDKSRKIYFAKEQISTNLMVEGFFIPIKEKLSIKGNNILQNAEGINGEWKCILEELETHEGEIVYKIKEFNKTQRESFKSIVVQMFQNFINRNLNEYLNDSEKQLLLRATKTFELIGTVLIFHYSHLKPVIDIYTKMKKNFKKYRSEQYQQKFGKYWKQENYNYDIKKEKSRTNKKYKFELKNYMIHHILKKHECKKFVKQFRRFWIMLKQAINTKERKEISSYNKHAYNRVLCFSKKVLFKLKHGRLERKRIFFKNGHVKISYFNRNVIWKKNKTREIITLTNKMKAEKKKITAIAVYKKVKGDLRQNEILLLCGENAKTVHTENKVHYVLNLKQCMFASGNGTERQRIKNLYLSKNNIVPKENVVDLFSGVGYFTLPLLKFVGDEQINNFYAYDKNPNSLKLLKKSILLNKIKKKNIHIHKQNSFSQIKNKEILGRCHRVLLGLLPKSENAWKNAFTLLDHSVGGVLHIHGISRCMFSDDFAFYIKTADLVDANLVVTDSEWFKKMTIEYVLQVLQEKNKIAQYKNKKDEGKEKGNGKKKGENKCGDGGIYIKSVHKHVVKAQLRYMNYNKMKNLYLGNNIRINLKYAQYVLQEISKIALMDSLLNKRYWKVEILNVEKVKSYAPHLYHFVVDIKCTPEFH